MSAYSHCTYSIPLIIQPSLSKSLTSPATSPLDSDPDTLSGINSPYNIRDSSQNGFSSHCIHLFALHDHCRVSSQDHSTQPNSLPSSCWWLRLATDYHTVPFLQSSKKNNIHNHVSVADDISLSKIVGPKPTTRVACCSRHFSSGLV
jgi:hypothetical protein